MPREIFDDVTRPSVRVGSRAWYVLPLSILAHVAAAAVIVVVPLVATDVLPSPSSVMSLIVPAPPVIPPIPPPPSPPAEPRPANTATHVTTDAAPTVASSTLEPELPRTPGVPDVGSGVPGGIGVPGGQPGGVLVGIPDLPPPPSPATANGPLRTGGLIKNPRKTRDVQPVYPHIAVANRVEGQVTIEATIASDGRVTNARVIGSVPLLDQAALDAVMRWQFTPTLLNGVPVPVIMTVTVNFTLR
jgi:TonB family protein